MRLSKVATKRLVLLVLAIACLVPALPAAAEPERPSRTEALAALRKSDADQRRRGALGLAIVGRMEDAPALIAALRDADERVRTVAEQALWAVWSRSGDARVDDLFGKGVAQMGEQRFPEAIATFTRIIELKPGFAEGWNKRATAYFLAGEYRRSLKDCDEVIKRTRSTSGCSRVSARSTCSSTSPRKRWSIFAARSRSIPTSRACRASRRGSIS